MGGASSVCPQLVSQAFAPSVSPGHLMGTIRTAVLLQHGWVLWVLPVGFLSDPPRSQPFLKHATPRSCWPQSQTPRSTQSVSRGRDVVEFLLFFPGLLMSKLRGCCKELSGRRHSRAAWGQHGKGSAMSWWGLWLARRSWRIFPPCLHMLSSRLRPHRCQGYLKHGLMLG